MSAPRDVDRLLNAFLREGPMELPDASYDEVRAHMDQTRQRAVIGSWRTPNMNNNIVRIGLAAAAVVVIAIIAINLVPGGLQVGDDPSVSPSAEPSDAASSAPPSTWTGLAAGPFVVTSSDDPVQVTFDIASPGWAHEPGIDFVYKDDDGLDPPESVGAALLAWSWPAGTGINVYGDACHWSTTTPATPATTPDEIADALTSQAGTEPSTQLSITVGGYAGTAIILRVPMSYHQDPDVGREEEFADCDEALFGYYAAEGEAEPSRNAQGPGQVDELWILDVDGSIVILDAAYGPATPADVVEEMRAMKASATFE